MRYKQPTTLVGLKVEVVNDQVEKALRKFKKKVQESGLLQDLREREFYEKPSETKRRSRQRAERRSRRMRLLGI